MDSGLRRKFGLSVAISALGFAILFGHPNTHGPVYYAMILLTVLLVTTIAVGYVQRSDSSIGFVDGLAVTGIAVIVAIPVLTLLEAVAGRFLWERPMAETIAVEPVVVVILLGVVALTLVPTSLMFALGTAGSQQERVTVVGLLVFVLCLTMVPALARSSFDPAVVLDGITGFVAAALLGAPLYVFGRVVTSEGGQRSVGINA